MDESILITEPGPTLDVLLQEYQAAGKGSNGAANIEFAESTRRMRWAGQSVDGRKWDRNMEEGEQAMPWDGCSDTKVSTVDEVINDNVAIGCVGFRKAEIHAGAMEVEDNEKAAFASAYLRWLVRSKLKRALNLEVELSLQYSQEYSWCVAYVGWEREISRRRVPVTMEQLLAMSVQAQEARAQAAAEGGPVTDPAGFELLPQLIMDPSQEEQAAELVAELYWHYVQKELASAKDFLEEEREDDGLFELKPAAAKRYVRELRKSGKVAIAMPYLCKNDPFIFVCKPWEEIILDESVELQKNRAIFWREWLTEAELRSKAAEGWDQPWIEAAVKTAGKVSCWGDGAGEGGASKDVGGEKWTAVKVDGSDRIEVVRAFVRKVDEDGVTGIYLTVFSPHVTRGSGEEKDFVAKHELLDFQHGLYPFRSLKRENLGRGLRDSRSVSEIANTWQAEEKNQRDMLFNRAQLDTLPPIAVPKLGGLDYRVGPAAQIPMGRAESISAIDLGGRAQPTLAIELLNHLGTRTDNYFGRVSESVPAFRVQVKQEMMFQSFACFWEECFTMAFALAVQFDPEKIARISGATVEQLDLDAYTVLDELDLNIQFDVKELNPDYLEKKFDLVHSKILPADRAGVVDFAKLTELELRSVDPILARKISQDKGSASKKVFKEVEFDVMKMFMGSEAEYVENDPTAGMKLQFLQTIISGNPRYMAAAGLDQEGLGDDRFKALLENYTKNLQQSMMQDANKEVGRLGVKRVGN